MKTLVFTGGGTLGHCLPNLAIYPYLTSFDKFYYIGSFDGPERKAVEGTIEYMPITTVKFKRSLTPDNLLIPLKLSKGIKEAKEILKTIHPNLVFSKGGFVSVPVCFAAHKLGIPVISHESDLTIGLANKLTKNKAKFILTSFPQTARSLINGIYTGNPIRYDVLLNKSEQGFKKYPLSGKKPIVLVIGGSSGAKAINDFIFSNLDKLLEEYEILHICGSNHTNNIKKHGYIQIPFEKDMALCYSICNLAISRCGANTAFELLARNIPTLFIPLSKKASRGDQIDNAKYFSEQNLCKMIEEENLTIDAALDSLNVLDINRKYYKEKMSALNLKDANMRIANIVNHYNT